MTEVAERLMAAMRSSGGRCVMEFACRKRHGYDGPLLFVADAVEALVNREW